MSNFDIFHKAYIEALYFTETGDERQASADAKLVYIDYARTLTDCGTFLHTSGLEQAFPEMTSHERAEFLKQAGHDFWFTRNGHGVGYWDRPKVYGEVLAKSLTELSKSFGEIWPEFELEFEPEFELEIELEGKNEPTT